jgi:hypothetical protein
VKVEKDFAELFKLFTKHKVRYCIIGSYAVAFYARPRYTKDIDVLIEAKEENGKRIICALKEFGFENIRLSAQDFQDKKRIIQLGYEPVRVDLLTSVPGCSFANAWKNKVGERFGPGKVFFIGLDDLIKVKRKSSRLQDKADLALLLEARKAKNSQRARRSRR